jgi:predicted transcriptional regulator of viral defense system
MKARDAFDVYRLRKSGGVLDEQLQNHLEDTLMGDGIEATDITPPRELLRLMRSVAVSCVPCCLRKYSSCWRGKEQFGPLRDALRDLYRRWLWSEEKRKTNMDWVTVIRKEAQTSSILRTDELARKYAIVPAAVTQALARQEQRELVEHISNKIYYNWLALDGSTRDLVNVLREDAYVSLESALREYGISTQSPRTLTCVTTERPKDFKGRTITISYRSISPRLYWGFVPKTTRYGSYLIAEPEKAILDWIYLGIQNGAAPALDELDFGSVDRPKLLNYARRFPSSTYLHVLPALVETAGAVKLVGAGAGAGAAD